MKNKIPYSIRSMDTSKIEDAQEWFGCSAEEVEKQEGTRRTSKNEIDYRIRKIKNKCQ